jgi:hypothetical protein
VADACFLLQYDDFSHKIFSLERVGEYFLSLEQLFLAHLGSRSPDKHKVVNNTDICSYFIKSAIEKIPLALAGFHYYVICYLHLQ